MGVRIHEVARRTGVTERTLRYYDEIGLLPPQAVTEAGYRVYGEAELLRLRQILLFREMGFSLSDIRTMMARTECDCRRALAGQRELLLLRRRRLDDMIALVERAMKEEQDLSFDQFKQDGMEAARRAYAEEAKVRWGHTEAYAESERKAAARDDQALWQGEGAKLLAAFAALREQNPAGEAAQELVAKWQGFITENYYACTKEILAGLGQMYAADERFTRFIDNQGEGTAAFMARAIEVYCGK